ncbi:hypothetical protein [Xylanimonas oleitrophica]|uniref:hypothetical protein n=1 Tax=Xylanimonas oleitrophica TaxID=2607479 RepID=UPI0011B41274|nr:hypothetical protein [Xylanimonas oleitrophica]
MNRRRTAVALLVLALTAGAGCAPSPQTTPHPASGAAHADGPHPHGSHRGSTGTPAGEPASALRVGLTEWSIETGGAVAAAGDVTVVVTNTGATGHDVVVRGRLGDWGTPVLAPGEEHELRIQTEAGETLELVCTVTGHHAAGMTAELRVAPS